MPKRDSKGNKVGSNGSFIQLKTFFLKSEAFRSASGIACKLLLCLAHRFKGGNNGEISMSVREAAFELNCTKNTAAKAFGELQRLGFIERRIEAAFSLKTRHAAVWELTWLGTEDEHGKPIPPKNTWTKLGQAKNQNAVSIFDRDSPNI